MKPKLWSTIKPDEHDVKLVVCDMDGTLLDGDRKVPEDFWPLVDAMEERGIVFAPASGRQYATLAKMFEDHGSVHAFVSDNGARVVMDGETISINHIARETAIRVIESVRNVDHRNIGLVAGGAKRAYVERGDTAFIEAAAIINIDLEVVDDLTQVDDDFVKMATYDFDGIEESVKEIFPGDWEAHKIVISARTWVDIVSADVNKGAGVAALQKHMGVTADETVVFGDYLNDLEMMDHAELSFAMENAHEGIRSIARYLAPSNTEHGVVSVMRHLLKL